MGATTNFSRTNFYFTMCLVNLMSIGAGNTYSWTSPTLPLLMKADSFLPIDISQASWIASLYLLGAAIGPFFASTLIQNLGFKWTFILCNIGTLASWIFLACTWTVYTLYFGRFLSGITVGLIYLTFPLYVAEISEDSLRAAMSSTLIVFRCVGILMEFAIGPFVSYHQLILINSVSFVLYLIFCYWMPESPYYLITRGKKDEAVRTVTRLRGGISQIGAQDITNNIQIFIDKTKNQRSMKDLIATRGNVKGLLISSTLLAFQQLSGVTTISAYTQQLFDMTGADISASTAAIIYGAVYLIGSAFGPVLAKQYGFRKPLIVSGIVLFASEFLLGVYLYCYSNGYDVSSFTWSPVACVLLFAGTFNFGVVVMAYGLCRVKETIKFMGYIHVFSTKTVMTSAGPMPWAIMGEIFPPNIKGQAAAIATTVAFGSAFITTKLFPILIELLHTYVVFWIFSASCLSISIFTAIFIPNTKGLSLDQIQDKLNQTKPKHKSDDIAVIT